MFRVGLAEANTAATAARSHCASSEPEPAESELIWLNAHRSGRNGPTAPEGPPHLRLAPDTARPPQAGMVPLSHLVSVWAVLLRRRCRAGCAVLRSRVGRGRGALAAAEARYLLASPLSPLSRTSSHSRHAAATPPHRPLSPSLRAPHLPPSLPLSEPLGTPPSLRRPLPPPTAHRAIPAAVGLRSRRRSLP